MNGCKIEKRRGSRGIVVICNDCNKNTYLVFRKTGKMRKNAKCCHCHRLFHIEGTLEEIIVQEKEDMSRDVLGGANKDTIRGDQVLHSKWENLAKLDMFARGANPHRLSWPDFFVEKDGEFYFLEIKGPTDSVSGNQAISFDLLTRLGMPVYVRKYWAAGRYKDFLWKIGVDNEKAVRTARSKVHNVKRYRFICPHCNYRKTLSVVGKYKKKSIDEWHRNTKCGNPKCYRKFTAGIDTYLDEPPNPPLNLIR